MTIKAWLAVSLEAAIVLAAAGCGQDVATCGTICGFADAPQGCQTACDNTQQECTTAGAAGDFQAYLTCVANCGSYEVVGGTCASQVATVTKLCGSTPASGDDGGSADSGVPIKDCTLGAPCSTQGVACTVAKAGPCSSDQRLTCGASGTLVADGFPCVQSATSSCTFSGTAPVCAETCSCVGGLEVCSGTCPDGG
jgi:hypothetical protein